MVTTGGTRSATMVLVAVVAFPATSRARTVMVSGAPSTTGMSMGAVKVPAETLAARKVTPSTLTSTLARPEPASAAVPCSDTWAVPTYAPSTGAVMLTVGPTRSSWQVPPAAQ